MGLFSFKPLLAATFQYICYVLFFLVSLPKSPPTSCLPAPAGFLSSPSYFCCCSAYIWLSTPSPTSFRTFLLSHNPHFGFVSYIAYIHTYTHTYTHTYVWVYVSVCVYACLCLCMWLFRHQKWFWKFCIAYWQTLCIKNSHYHRSLN